MLTKGSTAIDGLSGCRGRCRLRGGGRRSRCGLAVEHDLEDADRPADVLDLLLAEILEGDVEPVADLVAHRGRHADAAGFRHDFEPRGDVDAVAEDVVVLDDDVAEVDADAEDEAPRRAACPVAPRHASLEVDGAAHRVDDALEFDQHAVAGGLDDAALALAIAGSISSRRSVFSRASVPASSASISRL